MPKSNPLFQLLIDAVCTRTPVSPKKQLQVRASIKDIQARTAQGEDISIDDPIKAGGNVYNFAAQHNHLEVVDELIKANVDPNTRSIAGDAPLHWAISNKHRKMIYKLLVEAKADPNIQRDEITPLIQAKDDKDLVELLLKNGADPNAPYNTTNTPLFLAVKQGYDEIVQLLLDAKAKPELEIATYRNALNVAVENDNLKITQLLLDAGTRLETRNEALNTAIRDYLFFTYKPNTSGFDFTYKLPVINALLNHGAEIRYVNEAEHLFQMLQSSDQRDPHVLSILEHLRTRLYIVSNTHLIYQKVGDHLAKLKKAAAEQKDEFLKSVNPVMKDLLPPVLSHIVYSYDVPLERRIGFFRSEELFPKEEKKEPVTVEPRRRKCTVM